ncbi:MAG: cytochrome c biogenesis protein CcdA [Paludibacter sp.]
MRKKFIFSLLAIVVSLVSYSQIYEPVKWSFELKNTGKTTADVIIKATIEDGWHLYGMDIPKDGPRPTKIVFEDIQNAKPEGKIQGLSKLKEVYDPNFDMKLSWYANDAVFVQKISFADAAKVRLKGYVEFMVCNDESCLPPTQEYFDLGSKLVEAAKPVDNLVQSDSVGADCTVAQTVTVEGKTDYWSPVVEELKAFGNAEGATGETSLWLIFLAGLAGGFLALFTPCVWPIIPMTVSFFLKRSDDKKRGRRDASLYGLSIVFIYVTLGILITLIFGASALNSMSTNAVFNLIFFGMLLVFAISFFGAFEITLPASWSTKLDAKADSTVGFISILFMAFTLVLVSFSCTGPIIGTLLVEVSGSGSLLSPAIGMLGFAVALAIPFTFFAFFPSMLKSLPRSGGWLNTVKVVLAFLELALALKFLSVADLAYGWRILDREVFLVLWIVIFAMLGFYLLGKIRFPHDSESKHSSVLGTFLAIISLSFAVYMVPGLWGAPLKAISAFSPPLYTQDFNLYNEEVHPAFTDYDVGMAYAAQKGLPVVVDFTGYGCVNCRKMEASVWTDPRVKDLLENDVVLISVFVDDKTALTSAFEVDENGRTRKIKSIGDKWSYLQRTKFGANAQPFYVILDNKGNPLNKSFGFDENPENFIQWIEKGKENFKK